MRTASRIPLLTGTSPLKPPFYAPQRDGTYKIFIVTDTHFSHKEDSGTRYFSTVPNLMEQFRDLALQERPDMVIHLGDIFDGPQDAALHETFFAIWDAIQYPWLTKVLTVGNHDFDDADYTDLVNTFDYTGAPLLPDGFDESAFNYTFVLTKYNYPVRIVVLDTSFDSSGIHGNHYNGMRIHPAAMSWLDTILNGCDEELVLIFMHAGPQLTSYFSSTQRAQLKAIADAAIKRRPNLRIRWLFGHHHTTTLTTHYELGTENSIGYRCPAMIEGIDGRFVELTIDPSGEYMLTQHNITYQGGS